jgi:hypothetical protein
VGWGLLAGAAGLGEALAVGEALTTGELAAGVADDPVHPVKSKTATASTEINQLWIFVCIFSYLFQQFHLTILRREGAFGRKNCLTIPLAARLKIALA